MNSVLEIVKLVNGFLWSFLLLILLCGTGVYFTFKLKFIQVRKFGKSFKMTFGGIKFGAKAGEDGMSSFQSLATAIAAQVGTGNLAGAATAIATGGPGAIFWMWISAFFGMGTIFAEATAAQKYKVRGADGVITGGPVYYIQQGVKGPVGKFLAGAFALFIILALGLFGIMVQSNSIGDSFKTAFGINPLIMGIIIAVIVLIIVLGGVSRIASVTEKVVPFMALFYIIGSLIIVIMNYQFIIEALRLIVVTAFTPQAAFGAFVGSGVREAIRYGVARGLFSNEAGMGSTPHAHALAKVKHPCDQGLVAMMGVFIDTFIILTLTALVIITAVIKTGATGGSVGQKGIALTQFAFTDSFGSFGGIFIAICLLFFALSTIIGWYFFAQMNVKYLFGKKMVKVYALLVGIFIIAGSMLTVDLVWEMADMFNGLMVIPNLIGLLAVSKTIINLNKDYEAGKEYIAEEIQIGTKQ